PASSLSFYSHRPHRALHSFPTRRSSDLLEPHHPVPRLGPQGLQVAGGRHAERRPLVEVPLQGLLVLGSVVLVVDQHAEHVHRVADRKSTRLNSSHQIISYAVFCLKKKKT